MKRSLLLAAILCLALLVGGCLGKAATSTTSASTTTSTAFGESTTTLPGGGTESTTTSLPETTTTTIPATSFAATLTGEDEVPAVSTSASGILTLTFDDSGSTVHYMLQLNKLSHVTVARLHEGKAGSTGSALVTLYPGPLKPGVFSGVIAQGSFSAKNLVGPLKGKSLADLLALVSAGKVYINVGNSSHRTGAIRGQLAAAPPSDTTSTTIATTTMFTANLSGEKEIHEVSTSASGTLTLTVDGTSSTVHYVIKLDKISDVTVVRLHDGKAGTYGDPLITLYPGPTKTGAFSGVLAEGDFTAASLGGPLKGKSVADLVALIVSGKVYVNVGTSTYRSGEIRGQVQ